MDLEQVFNIVASDTRIKNVYRIIGERDKYLVTAIASHDVGHVARVLNNIDRVAENFDIEEEELYKAKIAALLHDVGCSMGIKKGHAERSHEMAVSYLRDFNIEEEQRNSILKAIKEHSGIASEMCGKLLTVADKLDMCKERILPQGLNQEGIRQYSHISGYNIKVTNNCLDITFIPNSKLDIDELNGYYFTEKIINTVQDFADQFGLISVVSVGDTLLANSLYSQTQDREERHLSK